MKHKTIYAGYAFSLLALIVLRVCQLAFVIESQTGFYKIQYNNFWILSLLAIAVSITAITFFSITDVVPESSSKGGKVNAVLSAAVAVGYLVKIVDLSQKIFGIISLGLIAAVVLAAGVYAYNSYSLFKGTEVKTSIHLLAIPFWIIELVYVFTENNDVSSLPEMTYDVITAALCLMASLYVIKHKAEMLTPKSQKITVALILVTSVFCIISTLPSYIILLFGKGYVLHSVSVADFLYFAYGIFLAGYVFSTFKPQKSN